jgi:hypothetical protein
VEADAKAINRVQNNWFCSNWLCSNWLQQPALQQLTLQLTLQEEANKQATRPSADNWVCSNCLCTDWQQLIRCDCVQEEADSKATKAAATKAERWRLILEQLTLSNWQQLTPAAWLWLCMQEEAATKAAKAAATKAKRAAAAAEKAAAGGLVF